MVGPNDNDFRMTSENAIQIQRETNMWAYVKLSRIKADSHIACRAHAVLLPCHAGKGLECVFPIWFTQCGRVWFTLAMPRPCHALTMPFFSRPRHITAVERRPLGYLSVFGFFRLPRGLSRRARHCRSRAGARYEHGKLCVNPPLDSLGVRRATDWWAGLGYTFTLPSSRLPQCQSALSCDAFNITQQCKYLETPHFIQTWQVCSEW